MNLLIIYGPPASGKLTIAEELATQTGYKLFHNHLTQDLAKQLYPAFDDTRFGLVDKLRLTTFEYAAKHGTDLIFTFVYAGDSGDDTFIDQTVKIIAKESGQVSFVELTAPDNVLLERLDNESRRRFYKLKDAKILSEQLETNMYAHSIKQPGIYKLDTTQHEPSESAALILEHFNIMR